MSETKTDSPAREPAIKDYAARSLGPLILADLDPSDKTDARVLEVVRDNDEANMAMHEGPAADTASTIDHIRASMNLARSGYAPIDYEASLRRAAEVIRDWHQRLGPTNSLLADRPNVEQLDYDAPAHSALYDLQLAASTLLAIADESRRMSGRGANHFGEYKAADMLLDASMLARRLPDGPEGAPASLSTAAELADESAMLFYRLSGAVNAGDGDDRLSVDIARMPIESSLERFIYPDNPDTERGFPEISAAPFIKAREIDLYRAGIWLDDPEVEFSSEDYDTLFLSIQRDISMVLLAEASASTGQGKVGNGELFEHLMRLCQRGHLYAEGRHRQADVMNAADSSIGPDMDTAVQFDVMPTTNREDAPHDNLAPEGLPSLAHDSYIERRRGDGRASTRVRYQIKATSRKNWLSQRAGDRQGGARPEPSYHRDIIEIYIDSNNGSKKRMEAAKLIAKMLLTMDYFIAARDPAVDPFTVAGAAEAYQDTSLNEVMGSLSDGLVDLFEFMQACVVGASGAEEIRLADDQDD